jgi:hypothetical protein
MVNVVDGRVIRFKGWLKYGLFLWFNILVWMLSYVFFWYFAFFSFVFKSSFEFSQQAMWLLLAFTVPSGLHWAYLSGLEFFKLMHGMDLVKGYKRKDVKLIRLTA